MSRVRLRLHDGDTARADKANCDPRSESHLIAFDPVKYLGYDPTARWIERYPNSVERQAVIEDTIREAMRAPVSPSGLYLQMVGGREDGMRLIQQFVAKNHGAAYSAFPISDPDAIAIVGEGRYFKPIYSTNPLVLCQCLPLRAEALRKLPPLNGLVRRLREHGPLR